MYGHCPLPGLWIPISGSQGYFIEPGASQPNPDSPVV